MEEARAEMAALAGERDAAVAELLRRTAQFREAEDRPARDLQIAPLRDAGERSTRPAPSAAHATARKATEAALAGSEARIKAMPRPDQKVIPLFMCIASVHPRTF